jgi:hypothetical protein
MQAGKFGYFPRLHVRVMGRGLRFCEVRATPGATPPEFSSKRFTMRFMNERITLSAKYPLYTMRIRMIADVDVVFVACPQAGRWIT